MMDLLCATKLKNIVFSPANPSIMITGDYNGNICVWNIAERSCVKLDGHDTSITSLCVSDDGQLLCSESRFVICCHDLSHDNVLLWSKEIRANFKSNIMFHDGRFIIGMSYEIYVFDALTGDEVFSLHEH